MKASAVKHDANRPQSGMKILTVSVLLPQSAQVDERTAAELLTLSLVGSGHLSQSQAAQALEISRYDLIELMGRYGVPILRYNPGELEQEARHLDELQAIRDRTPEAAAQKGQRPPRRGPTRGRSAG